VSDAATIEALNRVNRLLSDARMSLEPAEVKCRIEQRADGTVWMVQETQIAISVALEGVAAEASFEPASRRDVSVAGANLRVGVGMSRGR
jgi:hypothetical protein